MRKLLPLLLLSGCAAADNAPGERREIVAATSTGEPRTCIPLPIRESRVRSDQVIDFIDRTGSTYRVTLPQPCPGLGFEERFTYATSLNQLCAQDIITVLYQTGGLQRGASCGLAPFVPVELADRRR